MSHEPAMTPDSSLTPADRHEPVMVDRVVALMAPGIESALEAGRTPWVLDATLGMGGHSENILSTFPEAHLIGIDRDQDALAMAGDRLARFADRFHSFHGTYDQVSEALDSAQTPGLDAALYDLGVSSYQLDERRRGFAYSYDAPLDMRMDASTGLTAADVVNTYSQRDLERIIRRYGEEKFARRIAQAIFTRRQSEPFTRTGELADVIKSAVPAAAGAKGGHPAKRTFQAIRIEVNEELDVLTDALPAVLENTNIGGRIVVMSYHSLEDKIVKNFFKTQATSLTPPDFPVELEEHAPVVEILTRGTEKPTEQEISENSRAASAKVRAAQKIRPNRSNG